MLPMTVMPGQHTVIIINWNDFLKLYLPQKHRIQAIHSIEERARNFLGGEHVFSIISVDYCNIIFRTHIVCNNLNLLNPKAPFAASWYLQSSDHATQIHSPLSGY